MSQIKKMLQHRHDDRMLFTLHFRSFCRCAAAAPTAEPIVILHTIVVHSKVDSDLDMHPSRGGRFMRTKARGVVLTGGCASRVPIANLSQGTTCRIDGAVGYTAMTPAITISTMGPSDCRVSKLRNRSALRNFTIKTDRRFTALRATLPNAP